MHLLEENAGEIAFKSNVVFSFVSISQEIMIDTHQWVTIWKIPSSRATFVSTQWHGMDIFLWEPSFMDAKMVRSFPKQSQVKYKFQHKSLCSDFCL